ncbi:hypothetical protein [Nocardioides sp. KR10-350]|uniref:hypothetical protein n=1 Tax=Nocardioides cheoyonin TaxID=3156615 RepID=UPI0032B3445E
MAENPGTAAPAVAPPAVRASRAGWRDPRLWLGVALVAACVVAGARIIGSADDTVQVWALAHDVAAGDVLTEDDLRPERVHFADGSRLGDYYEVDDALPADFALTHGGSAGELLPRSAVGPAGGSGLLQVPISVDPAQVPPAVEAGSVVDVYVGRPPARDEDGPALGAVDVVSVVPPEESFSASGTEQLTLAVKEKDVPGFLALVGSLDEPAVSVVLRR